MRSYGCTCIVTVFVGELFLDAQKKRSAIKPDYDRRFGSKVYYTNIEWQICHNPREEWVLGAKKKINNEKNSYIKNRVYLNSECNTFLIVYTFVIHRVKKKIQTNKLFR